MKMKSIKLSDYFEIRNPKYEILKLTPTKSNKNNQTDKIAELVNKMYRKTNKLIYKENKKLIVEPQYKFMFCVHIEKYSVKFFTIIPKIYSNQFKVKFREIWKNIQIDTVDKLPIDINSCTKFQLSYKNDDALSLKVDLRDNSLLNANLSVVDIMKEEEVISILYNFIPVSEKSNNYFKINTYPKSIQKYKNGENLKKSKNIKDLSIIVLKNFILLINNVINVLLNTSQNSDLIIEPLQYEISSSTRRKGNKAICNMQGLILVKSTDKTREIELSNTLANTFKVINDNNELIINKVTKNIDIKRTVINHVNINKTTIEEDSNFISLPSTDVIKQFNIIEHNKIVEIPAPKSLCNGEIRIGTVKVKENKQDVFYSTDEQIKRLSKVLLGSMGAGKDYYMVNMAKDIIKANRGLIVIDYIDKCQLAENIKNITPKERLIEIDCSNPNTLQSFLYNEVTYKEDDNIYTKMEISMQKAQQFELLLNSVNDVGSELTPRMLRYLYCSGTIAFYNNINSSFKDVIDILKSPSKRAEVIQNLDEEGKNILVEEIEDLEELNKIDKKGNIENYDSKVDGILDRIAKLKSASLYTKLAFNRGGDKNIDFITAMNERKVILIKIPHKSFKTKMLKDLMCTFYLSKIWQAKQLADKNIQTEVFINELHQSYHSQLLLEDILVEHRKYNITFTFAMHYLDQLTKKCKKSIISSGASFLLISGCDPKAFDELEVYFNKDGYTREDIAQLERYNALCLIKNEDENYSSFICKLPS